MFIQVRYDAYGQLVILNNAVKYKYILFAFATQISFYTHVFYRILFTCIFLIPLHFEVSTQFYGQTYVQQIMVDLLQCILRFCKQFFYFIILSSRMILIIKMFSVVFKIVMHNQCVVFKCSDRRYCADSVSRIFLIHHIYIYIYIYIYNTTRSLVHVSR